MRFSQRIGKIAVRTALQVESMDDPLKNRLWNTIINVYLLSFTDFARANSISNRGQICKLIWEEFFTLPITDIPRAHYIPVNYEGFERFINNWFFKKAEWNEIYDLVEFISQAGQGGLNQSFINACNVELTKEVSGYRIIGGKVVQITSKEEIDSIQESLAMSDRFQVVNGHLGAALGLLSDRQSPDYRNSIKESISAVEAMCIIISNDPKASLGKALAIIEKKHSLHGSLKEAYSKIYGYASDASGIRHAMLDDGLPIEFEDAKFMLVSCSAFINYLKAKLKL